MRSLAIFLTLVVSVLCISMPALAADKAAPTAKVEKVEKGSKPTSAAKKASKPAKADKSTTHHAKWKHAPAKKPSKHGTTARVHHAK